MKIPLTIMIAGLLAPSLSQAATINLSGGSEGGAVLQGLNRYVVDLGFLVPTTLPVTTNLALFEAGGDGDGTAISLIGNSLNVYLDFNGSSNFADDTTFDLNISAYAGQVVSIRLQGDYSGGAGSDTVRLDVTNGFTTLTSNTITLVSNHLQPAGGDGFGTGGRGGNSWAGISEDGAAGAPNMDQFNTTLYDISDGGANVLGSDVIVGNLYTGAVDSDTALGT
ncbi:MAG: hypothetical protein PVJ98_11060 [Akkermansiaceae bacterium]|jgi:hypothetical protein